MAGRINIIGQSLMRKLIATANVRCLKAGPD
ncbi:hypothetical protein FOMG_15132 [Fusarium oxysporum f. sp. melonis 26406]|uniref:Uncharacterized protein n=1 Tax=Fusarium oxysporum f. sp. melonis 26406 TaxID=1089452 RepID=W9ZBC8_FUSOX|nr:hypothetical protein FOMG_15132 [Fusarium oxysporum f. sp. melonis 26406]